MAVPPLDRASSQRVVDDYISLIEDAKRHNKAKPAAAAHALAELRLRLKRDLLMGNLAPEHYGNLNRNIGQSMAKVRIQSVRSSMPGLPPGVLVRLEVLLEDGILSPDEQDLVAEQLSLGGVDAKHVQDLRSIMEAWVETDMPAR